MRTSLVFVLVLCACKSKAAPPPPPAKPARTLAIAQSQFQGDKPGPALLVLHGASEISDPTSNVFHKAVAFRGGILTAGASAAALRHWTLQDGTYVARTLWQPTFGGRFDRLRDFEIGNVDADPALEIVVATHDQGVIAIGDETDGTWTFTELLREPDTFVHEIEIGDVDGDGKNEIYASRSGRNRADGSSQPGSIVSLSFDGTTYKVATVIGFPNTHAKEILAADTDRDGKSELYVVKEAEIEITPEGPRQNAPVEILKIPDTQVATLDDRQSRFLLACDADYDGDIDLVATGMQSGVWFLQKTGGAFAKYSIDKDSEGFEHAAHCADLDGDGRVELYVAADRAGEIRRYVWNQKQFDRSVVTKTAAGRLTWFLSDVP